MNTIELDDALRSLLGDICDAAGTPRDFAELPGTAKFRRGRWPGALAAAGLAAAAVAGLIFVSAQRSRDPGEAAPTTPAAAWLDMRTPPDGLERVADDQLTGLSVCLDAQTVAAGVVCNRIEGRIEIAYSSTTDAAPTYEIQTLFSNLELASYVSALVEGPAFTRTDLTVRGGRAAALIDGHNGVVLLVWQERPGVIGQFRSVDAPPDTDVPALVEMLIDRPWPEDVDLPIAAVDFGIDWTATDNNHPYVIASHRDNRECLSIGFAPTDTSTAATTCSSEALGWTSGEITTTQPNPYTDVVAGWVPDNAATVRLTFADDTVIELPTNPVAGFARRAWAYLIPADQGTRFSAHLTVLDGAGTHLSEADIDFVNPLVFVDTVCASTETDGIVPDLIGLPMYDAADAVRAAGLIIAHPLRGDPSQVITAQVPVAGTDRGCGDVVLTFGPAEG